MSQHIFLVDPFKTFIWVLPKGIGRIWICSVIKIFCDGKEALLYKHTLLVKTTDSDKGLHRRLGHILKNYINFKVKKSFVNKEKYIMTITYLDMWFL